MVTGWPGLARFLQPKRRAVSLFPAFDVARRRGPRPSHMRLVARRRDEAAGGLPQPRLAVLARRCCLVVRAGLRQRSPGPLSPTT